jgi:hypothetical protein
MTSALTNIIYNLVAALLGAAATYLGVRVKQTVRQQALDRTVRLFFGLPGHVVIIHSAIADRSDGNGVVSYSYPATDTRAARTLTTLFESVGLREGRDFTIRPDRPDRALPVDKLSDLNIVLLCGPARNGVFEKVAATLPMRYSMTVTNDRKNKLVDQRREQELRSSREINADPNGPAYDCALVASLPNPNNHSKRIVILAGIHGTGTVGAAEFVADLRNLRILDSRRNRNTISEVIRVDYDSADIETPTRIELV